MLRRMDLGGLTQEFQWAFSPKGLHTKNWFTRFWTPQEPCFSEYISKLLGWQFSYHLLGWVTQKLQLPISQEPIKIGFHFLPHSTPQVAYYLEYIAKPLGQTISIIVHSRALCIIESDKQNPFFRSSIRHVDITQPVSSNLDLY